MKKIVIDEEIGIRNKFKVYQKMMGEKYMFGKVNKNRFDQKLYNDLIEKGSKSLIDALEVGATIEDVDIFDLEKLNTKIKNEDIRKLYEQLICGSENHMRAFTGHLKFRKSSYTPQYLSQKRFNSIVNGEHKMCFELNN